MKMENEQSNEASFSYSILAGEGDCSHARIYQNGKIVYYSILPGTPHAAEKFIQNKIKEMQDVLG
jgi:hypothetical protein